MSQRTTRRRVNIVPHTHWDREWYLPFQEFRLHLVEVLDELLPRMEADPGYAHFMLDGQLAVVDDYLAIRPDAADSIRRLTGAGRLTLGPWYTLPDEFLVSGETLIRNLQLGLRVASHYGGAMTVGYLPDMFGHIAQMPQLFRQFGFGQAVVWRGTPSAVDRTGFWWRAPDGSTLRTEYLPEGYGNGAALPRDGAALVNQVAEFENLWSDLLGDAPVLWMNGADHQAPQPWLGPTVAAANALQDDYELVVTSLPEHLGSTPVDALPSWDGELRSGARANLLMGVTSNRVDIRQAAARAERNLERLAEPLAALLLPADAWPEALLAEAWLGVIRNAAHDSVCACSADDVCDAVVNRYTEASQIAEGLARQAVRHLDRTVADPDTPGRTGPLAVNPTARARSGLVELTWPDEAPPPGTQVVAQVPAEGIVLSGPVALVVPGTEEVNWDKAVESFALEVADDDHGVPQGTVLVTADRSGGALITSAVRAELAAVDHPGPVRLRVRRQPETRILAPTPVLPGFGWAPFDFAVPTTASVTDSEAPPTPQHSPAWADDVRLGNGLVQVEVDPTDGTWSLDGTRGLGRLVDGGDCGDTYNWCPPTDDLIVDTPTRLDVQVTESGPLRARIQVDAGYVWPERTEGLDRRVGEVEHTVTTTLEVRTGEPFVRVESTVDNRSRDHRLRIHLPLPEPATYSRAECAFAVVERGLTVEGGPTEQALPTFPARRFVQAGGLTVIHDGVTEYELVADGSAGAATGDTGNADDSRDDTAGDASGELALTFLRANGMLSQGPMPTRPLPAGPLIPLEGPQLQQPVTVRYAVATEAVDPYALADEVLVPLQSTWAAGHQRQPDAPNEAPTPTPARRPSTGSALTVRGAEVSSLVRSGGQLQLRIFNPSDRPTTVQLPGRRGWEVDLRDRPQAPFEETVELRPWGIATLTLASGTP